MRFHARQFELVFPRRALVMGVVNVTPDSFSDGGKYLDPDAAVAHAMNLVAEGAEILDIGGESTRPGAQPVSEPEELRRVIPVIERLAARLEGRHPERELQRAKATGGPPVPRSVLISIDTMKPAVARAALAAGASIVNDVAANRDDVAMWQTVAEFGAGYICMHSRGTPQTMQQNAVYVDVVQEVAGFFRERMGRLSDAGVQSEQIVLDVGIGFGKTMKHNLQLLANLRSFTTMARPLLIGVSRKSFIGRVLDAGLQERLAGSLACACLAIASGVQIIRAHDVEETVQAVRMTEAVLARTKE